MPKSALLVSNFGYGLPLVIDRAAAWTPERRGKGLMVMPISESLGGMATKPTGDAAAIQPAFGPRAYA